MFKEQSQQKAHRKKQQSPKVLNESQLDKKNIRKPRQMSLIFLMVLGVPLTWSVVAGIISTTEFTRDYLLNFIQVSFVVGILGLMFTYKTVMKTVLVFLGCFILFILYGFLWVSDPPGFANEFANLLTNTVRYVIGIESHTMAYQRIVVWVIIGFFSLFVVVFTYYRFVFMVLFTVLTTIFSLLITSAYFSYPRSLYVFIVCILALLIRRMHLRSSEKTLKASPYSRLILPITVACFFLVGFLPMPEQGATQGGVREFIVRPFHFINESFYNITQRRDFSIRQIGFGGVDGRLGGSVVINHEVFMRVRTDGRLPLYITGATSDTYTGYSWRNTFVADTPVDFTQIEQSLELLERFINMDIITTRWFSHEVIDADEIIVDGIVIEPYLQRNPFTQQYVQMTFPEVLGIIWNIEVEYYTMEVDVLHFRPSFAFHSGIVNEITTEDEEIYFFRDRDGRFTLNQRLQRNSHYTVRYHKINQIPFIYNVAPWGSYVGFLQSKSDEPESFWVQTTVQGGVISRGILAPITYITIRFEDFEITYLDLLNYYLIPRAAQITETYTTLPDDFPERIRQRAYEVTRVVYPDFGYYGLEFGDFTYTGLQISISNYQKMRMLEEYLSQNYLYTLSPGEPPDDMDFVYHFLFDIQKGHCVYFATAFVTMARSLGLPARYVEGFLVNGIPDEDGYIEVLNSMAHAWPEVYFEGYGWHPFEPTPATGLPQLRDIPETGELDWNYWMDPYIWGHEEWDRDVDILELLEGQAGEDEVAYGEVDESGVNLGFWSVAGLTLLGLGVLALIRGLWVHIGNISWRRKGNSVAVIHGFDSVLSYLKIFNYEMKDGETVFRFMERVCNKRFLTSVDEKRRLEGTAKIYEKVRYGNQEVSSEERVLVESTVRSLDNRAKSYLGSGKYYFYRYILARVN
jgi:transglutaminase-like putative cysteine protease